MTEQTNPNVLIFVEHISNPIEGRQTATIGFYDYPNAAEAEDGKRKGFQHLAISVPLELLPDFANLKKGDQLELIKRQKSL